MPLLLGLVPFLCGQALQAVVVLGRGCKTSSEALQLLVLGLGASPLGGAALGLL